MGKLANIPGAELADLAAEINENHELAVMYVGQSFDCAVKAGLLLMEAKAQVQHGKWLNWLKANVKVSARQAQNYMKVASCPEQKRNAVADLSLREAVSLLSDTFNTAKTTSELEPEDRVAHRQAETQAKADKRELEKHDHQVKEFLVATKAYEGALTVAAKSASKFGLEHAAFTVWRLDKVVADIEATKQHLVPQRYAARPMPKPRSGKPVVGLEAARRHYLDLCADPGVDLASHQRENPSLYLDRTRPLSLA